MLYTEDYFRFIALFIVIVLVSYGICKQDKVIAFEDKIADFAKKLLRRDRNV